MMTAFECYKTYLALKNHFTKPSYDYHKYGGKVSASVKSFESRRDRYYFEKLSKKPDATGFMLSNILSNPNTWVGELVSDDRADRIYKAWQKRNQSLSYTFREEVSSLSQHHSFDRMFESSSGRHPILLQEFLRKKVSIETLIILCHMTKCFPKWNSHMEYDPVWKETALKIVKYQPFMKYNLAQLRKIVVDIFKDL